MQDHQRLRYSRHLLLEGWHEDTQERLMQAKVLVVGAGGLGSAALMTLAASGVGTLMVMDPDRLELSNLQRQWAYRTSGLGEFKVQAARQAVHDLNADVQFIPVPVPADAQVLPQWVTQADVVLDCTDNWPARQLINRVCVQERKPLVFGAALRHEAQWAVFDTRDAACPCYACVFPPAHEPESTSCALMGVFAPLVGMVGAAQAAEAIKLITGLGRVLAGRLILFESAHMTWREMTVPRIASCSVCSSRAIPV